jgi:uncharacterized protein YkwD
LLCTPVAGSAQAATRGERFGDKLLGYVNGVRAERGLVPYREVPTLSSLAREHSLHMARQRRLFHTRDLGSRVRAWRPNWWGENVGVGPSMWRIVQMWERSPGHLVNMVRPGYHRVGVGVVYTHGAYWATLIVIS